MGNVIISPEPHFQFLDTAGNPLSNGFIFTYDAGTSNLRSTYADSSGLIPNPNPIPLDATGSPSNGSVQVGIWIANQSYKFVAFNSAMVQQWSSDNISGYFGLLNLANVWTFGQTFSAAITDTLVDNQIITGAPGNQTTLDYPPPVGNVTLHFPNTTDTMVGRATTDTLTNKTLTSPITNGGTFNTPSLNVLKNTTLVHITGDTTLHTIYTIVVPGGAMGLSNQLRITLTMTPAVAGGAGAVRITYGGSLLSVPVAIPAGASNSSGYILHVIGGNVGATNVQSWDSANAFYGAATSGNTYHQTTAIDSTVNQNLVVTYQAGANSDDITFYRCLVEIL